MILGSKTTAIDPLDCAAIAKEFPLTYGLPVITIKASDADKEKAQSGAPLRLVPMEKAPSCASVVPLVYRFRTRCQAPALRRRQGEGAERGSLR